MTAARPRSRIEPNLCFATPQNGNFLGVRQRPRRRFGNFGSNPATRETQKSARSADSTGISRILTRRKIGDRTGWLAAQFRSHKSPRPFPANREFYREISKFGHLGASETWIAGQSQALSAEFPARDNRELSYVIREFSWPSRVFRCWRSDRRSR